MYGADDDGNAVFDDSRTKITKQQRTKYFLHWGMILFFHFEIFWYIPVQGNLQLYLEPYCDPADRARYRYGCKNFESNFCLGVFYTLICIYLILSSNQLRWGMPLFRKASSVF